MIIYVQITKQNGFLFSLFLSRFLSEINEYTFAHLIQILRSQFVLHRERERTKYFLFIVWCYSINSKQTTNSFFLFFFFLLILLTKETQTNCIFKRALQEIRNEHLCQWVSCKHFERRAPCFRRVFVDFYRDEPWKDVIHLILFEYVYQWFQLDKRDHEELHHEQRLMFD